MITNPTVFVLGAGASIPFGFPSGQGLVELICDKLGSRHDADFRMFQDIGYTPEHIREFCWCLGHSGRCSVDEFLEHRNGFIEVGKQAIAAVLLSFERTRSTFDLSRRDNWYQYLFSLLNTDFDSFGENALSVITFNYDRSLENYLFTALQNSYGKTDAECEAKLSGIPIVHVHGKLGRLPWETSGHSEVRYDSSNTPSDRRFLVTEAGRCIKIVHESIEGDPEFQHARELLIAAKHICFLGFGFNQTNLERLGVDLLCDPEAPRKTIHGTCHGLSHRQRRITSRYRHSKFSNNPLIGLHDEKVYEFLYNNPNLKYA